MSPLANAVATLFWQALYAPILITFGHLSNVLYATHHDESMRIAGYAFVASWIAQFVGHGKVSFRGPHQTAGEIWPFQALRLRILPVHSLPSGLFRRQQCTDKEHPFFFSLPPL